MSGVNRWVDEKMMLRAVPSPGGSVSHLLNSTKSTYNLRLSS